MNLDTVVCPGCGWTGLPEQLRNPYENEYTCPVCEYGSDRSLTIREMLKDNVQYQDVRMDLFLKSIIKTLSATDI